MGFPFQPRNMSVMRVPVNPLDRSTVISAYPKPLDELKPTLQPGRFFIPAAPANDVSVVVVGPSSWFKELEPDQPLLEIVESSMAIAKSIVDDYCNGLLGADDNSRPAIFWAPGEMTKDEVKKKFASQILLAIEKQKNYFRKLVEMADAFWVRSNGNPMVISEDMRMAATQLNLLDKPWLSDVQKVDLVKCKACMSLIAANVIICPNCKVILDEKRAADLKFAR